jgi:hypothetical protein
MAPGSHESVSRSWARRSAGVALLLAILIPREAAARARFGGQILPAYFTGEFGGDVETRILYVPLVFSVSSERQDFRITVPFLSIRTEEPVLFVGGDVVSPASGGSGSGPSTESGPGDIVLKEEVFLIKGDGAWRPWVSGIARIKVPTADEERGLGTGKLDYGPGAGLIQPLGGRWTLLAEFLYVVRGDPSSFDLRNTLWSSAGVQLRATSMTSLYLFLESRQSVLPGREAIRDLTFGYDRRLSDAVTFRSAAYLGLSDTAEDFGLSLGIAIKGSERAENR